ncbi:Predicted protein [Taphrina deformans PYCC 5710]|uniref:Uncharacterized protein n=1 Tax=Taphrina deformans (strain PYCC 5710 / ATCC 11124 / CBS 356.35 / IMI 108563 / JCM 9778 / NBRC 8474) TaxID=1097556 RepID=R4XDA6_TAPDE|nr:Predicted protein [Taphrina deformans PYCC 5710]|eukprot:CCG82388.1 Predicted protein [Taphrina deformans PYCC 5710]
MAGQLIILFTTLLAQAKVEELKTAIYAALQALFVVAKGEVNALPCRPTLAQLISLSLKESASIGTSVAALRVVHRLYTQIEADAAAGFLPGTVSSLTKVLLKQNQKSSIIIESVRILEICIVKAFDGTISGYRSSDWYKATEGQLLLAMTPVLSRLAENDHNTVRTETIRLCEHVLARTGLIKTIYLEFLLRLSPASVLQVHKSGVADILESYVDAMIRILNGADEARKVQMLQTMSRAMPCLPSTSRQILSQRILLQFYNFIQFAPQNQILHQALKDEMIAPSEPVILHIAAETQKHLTNLLAACEFPEPITVSSPETFWIAQKSGFNSYAYAMENISSCTNLCLSSILAEAQFLGPSFKPQLMHVLYAILALPETNYFVLESISQSCHYISVQEMLIDNADYVINQLQLAFVTLDLNPRTTKVLGLLVRVVPEIVELIDDVVATFFEVLDDYHAHQVLVSGIFESLEAVVQATAGIQPVSKFELALDTISIPNVEKSFEDRFDEAQDIEPSQAVDESPVAKDPRSYTMVLHIMEKAQLFLSHDDPTIRIRVLELLHKGVPVISQNEDKFLPLIHTYWPQLTRRIEDDNPFVVAAVLRLIARTITFAGSFMRTRIMADVLPVLRQLKQPQKDKRGNVVGLRAAWEGTGRRKVAECIQSVLEAIQDDGGLTEEELQSIVL